MRKETIGHNLYKIFNNDGTFIAKIDNDILTLNEEIEAISLR